MCSSRFILVLHALIFVAVLCLTTASPQDATTRSPIDEATLDSALKDRRYLMRQLKCALGEAPCDPVGRKLKSLAPLVLRGSCPKCTPEEVRQVQKVLSYIQRSYPKEWNKIVQQYNG